MSGYQEKIVRYAKRQKNKKKKTAQFEETEQVSEPDMIGMLG